jgi:hypothetical protein
VRRRSLVAVLLLWCASCTDRNLPLAPTAVATPTPPLTPPPLPTTVPGVLRLALPGNASEMGPTGFGLTPFGYHGDQHAEDGHAGWDFGFSFGATVRAAAAGVVEAVLPDAGNPARTTVWIEHVVGTHYYRTIYTNLETVAAGIEPSAVVATGQALGAPGLVSRRLSSQTVLSYRMTHFQLDDFEYYRNVANPNAVSPEPFLTPAALSEFNQMWPRISYPEELVEPFITNPRDLTFPASRTWIRAGGSGPAGIRFTRHSSREATIEYALLAESGTVIEQGQVELSTSLLAHYSRIDLVSGTGRRIGAYSITSSEMRLTLVDPGSARPIDGAATDVYRTSR